MDWSWVVLISIQLPRCEGRRSPGVLGWTAAFVGALLCASAFVGTARAEDRPPSTRGLVLGLDPHRRGFCQLARQLR